jgi:Flp pilus assembly protein TadG
VSLHKLLNRDVRGQAMVETALALPLLLGLTFNVVNFGYFFVMAVNLAAAPRTGALYSIIGPSTPSNPVLPPPASVNSLTTGDLTNAISNGSTAPVQVCTAYNGTETVGGQLVTQCTRYNSSPTYAVAADPEQPTFVANQVDVTYTFAPLIDRRVFNLVVLAPGLPCSVGAGGDVTCTFHRRVVMRAMN